MDPGTHHSYTYFSLLLCSDESFLLVRLLCKIWVPTYEWRWGAPSILTVVKCYSFVRVSRIPWTGFSGESIHHLLPKFRSVRTEVLHVRLGGVETEGRTGDGIKSVSSKDLPSSSRNDWQTLGRSLSVCNTTVYRIYGVVVIKIWIFMYFKVSFRT